MKALEKEEIKRLSDQLDALNHKDLTQPLLESPELYAANQQEKEVLIAEIARLKVLWSKNLSKQGQQLEKLSFSRPITKKEQADMGSLKKRVRGLIVVHPMTALGREMGLSEVTGYADKPF